MTHARIETRNTADGKARNIVMWFDAYGIKDQLKAAGYTICSIEQVHDSVSLDRFEVTEGQKLAIVFGNEVKGVSQAVVDGSDVCIEIPQHGTKHSLNISCCAAIVMWQLALQYQ